MCPLGPAPDLPATFSAAAARIISTGILHWYSAQVFAARQDERPYACSSFFDGGPSS
jgi:hypothetical protein